MDRNFWLGLIVGIPLSILANILTPQFQSQLNKYDIPFYDASEFQIPDGIEGPSIRDKLFLTKASLHFLVWNGHSSGIAKLKKFFDVKRVSYQIVFC